ncbi:ultra-long-chain fatty acid omega-hydroxylase-like [Haliotis rufescens]|uniref:ultra-long-chain fatty acid omega-hydroxylase-like n=1 Tax=Haliotis rufescens TaxID=6454 RepID=UPI001EAFEF67|nr:ultra-long-chain fatty acid omega-hydroxylase-like [Haliotis rufescens]XP_046358300.1 ultra-long-chain fatty acid omega-hydroxylase-like [Haliotis rufescens]
MGPQDLVSRLNRKTVLQSAGTSVLLYVAYRVIRFLVWYRRLFSFFNKCQGVKDFSWRTGNLHLFPKEFEKRAEVEKEWMRRYPKYFRLWIGPLNPVIRVYHPDSIRAIIKSSEPKPRGFGGPYETLLPWLGEGLLIAGGQRWYRSRRLLTPAFHFDILKPYVDVSNNAIDTMMEKIDKHVEEGTSFEVFNMISMCTFDILLRCAMSVEENIQQQGQTHPYVNAVNDLLALAVDRNINPLHFFDFIFYNSSEGKKFKKQCDFVHRWAEDIIDKRRQTLERDGPPKTRYLDFLDVLLSARDADDKGLTPLEIRNEVDTFLFEGHDTTASGISWTLFTMASKPEFQTRIQNELDTLLDGRESKHITWDDIPKMEYLTRCLKEGMRFHSPVPFVSRKLENPMNIDGKVFPVGTLVSLGIWNIHHNPEVWEDPDVYDPDRFLPENIQKKDTYAYIPFSAGPRNCIGQHFALNEEKVMLGRILQRYKLEVDMSHKVGRRTAGVMKSTEGLWVFARHRH